jgi:hypothetical protein
MDVISFIVLILLSLVGFSAGAVAKAGKSVQLKPQISDLILITVIWAGAIYSRIVLDINRWLVIILWLILSGSIGTFSVWLRQVPAEKDLSEKEPLKIAKNFLQGLWQSWRSFSIRMGNFQSRIVLSLFFFTIVTPFALTLKTFSDPLRIGYRGSESNWLPRMQSENNLERFKRQF